MGSGQQANLPQPSHHSETEPTEGLQTPGFIQCKTTKLGAGEFPLCRHPGGHMSCICAEPETNMWPPGTGLLKSRVSSHTEESFCKQMPQVSSQTGQHTRSVSADLTLKIGL